MYVKEHPELSEASQELYDKNQDRNYADECRKREDYYARERYIKEKFEEYEKKELEYDVV